MTPTKWIEQTNAIGIVSKSGRYGGGTYAHSDIAMAFATWISPEFQLYIMKDYCRLKQDENSRFSLDWNLNRALSKVNYRIHTDAVKESILKIMESIRQPDRMVKIRYLLLLLSEGLYRIRFIVVNLLWKKQHIKKYRNM